MPFLQFKGKTAIESYHRVVPHHVIEVDKKLSLSKSPGLDGNLIIEGDNLIALKSLLPTHAGRIKCVYIDPPYNTGSEGWIYNDNLTQPQFKEWLGKVVGKEGEDATRHDKWCCMIYPRLQLLKELLREDGAIFISIDDNEVHHLRMLMDEIFGQTNFVASIAWQKRTSPDARATLGAAHDYIVVYAKRLPELKATIKALPLRKARAEAYQNPDDDTRGPWASVDLTGQTGHATPAQFYTIVAPGGRRHPPPKGRCWGLAETTFKKLASEGRIWFGQDGNSRPRLKRFLSDSEGAAAWTWWPHEEVGSNQEATQELNEMFGRAAVFDNPKPLRLIKRILQLATEKDSIVLDSFAGSGTTGHAALSLNRDDGGNRSFIQVQAPFDTAEDRADSKNICRVVTRERTRLAIEGFTVTGKEAKQRKEPGLGGAFTYAHVGPRLLGEYRDLGDKPPTYEQMAKYVWFTETSRPFDVSQINEKTGKIGEWQSTSYYLLYSPGKKDARPLDAEFLRSLKDKNSRKVIYCEKLWLHRDALREFGDVRAVLVPFNLK